MVKKINKDHKQVDIMEMLLHPIYRIFGEISPRYTFIIGSKDNGKSKVAAQRVVTKFLSNPNRNVAVLRKYAAHNMTSTLNDILGAFEVIADLYNLPQLKPISAEEHRRGHVGRIVYNKTSPGKITDTETESVIMFTGLDRLGKGGGSPTKNPKHATDLIGYEEIIDMAVENIDTMDDSSLQAGRIAESTVFRGFRDMDEQGNSFIKEEFSGVKPQVMFTGNAHDGDHGVMRDFADLFVPLNIQDKSDIERMEKEFIRPYYDPDFQGGDGLLVIRTSAFLNPGRDVTLIEEMKRTAYEQYCYLYCGATAPIGGRAYDGHLQFLDTSRANLNLVGPLTAGIDHAVSIENGDGYAVEFFGSSMKYDSRNVGGYPDFNKKIYFDELGGNNKLDGFKDSKQLAKETLDYFFDMVNNNDGGSDRIMSLGFAFVIDNNAQDFAKILFDYLQNKINSFPNHRGLKMVTVVFVEGKNESTFINGIKTQARMARVKKNIAYLDSKSLQIDKVACPRFFRQFSMTSIRKNGDNVEVIDKERDFVDAGDYAGMVQGVNKGFDERLTIKLRNNQNEGNN